MYGDPPSADVQAHLAPIRKLATDSSDLIEPRVRKGHARKEDSSPGIKRSRAQDD
jgi:hypothetical protein